VVMVASLPGGRPSTATTWRGNRPRTRLFAARRLNFDHL
jgi:hypothetical protein